MKINFDQFRTTTTKTLNTLAQKINTCNSLSHDDKSTLIKHYNKLAIQIDSLNTIYYEYSEHCHDLSEILTVTYLAEGINDDDPRTLTWTCHICGEERPDDKISVFQSDISKNGETDMLQNVRYCNDNPTCIAQAPTYELVPGRTPRKGRTLHPEP